MRKVFKIVFAALVLIAGLNVAASAQRNGGRGGRNSGIDARERRQQQRIDKGVANGSLTPKEAAALEKKEAKVKQLEAKLRENGLTPKERKRLEKDLDKLNREIYKLEHNNHRRTT